MDNTQVNTQGLQFIAKPEEQQQGNKNKLYIFKIIVILLVAIGISVSGYLAYQKFYSPKKVTNPKSDILIAEIAGQKIYRKDVIKLAQEQYATSNFDKKTLETFYSLLIERKLLDIEATKLGITVSDSEISIVINQMQPESSVSSTGSSQAADTKSIHNIVRYNILKNKITSQVVKSKEAYMLGYWLPPLENNYPMTDEQKQKLATQRIDGKKALEEALPKIKNGENFVDAAEAMYAKYPSLRFLLTVNGYILKDNGNDYVFNRPKIYTLDGNEKEAYNQALKKLNVGETILVFQPNGEGGMIIKVISISEGSYDSYDAWLNAKRKQSVKIYNPL